jgi:hypothetical protein
MQQFGTFSYLFRNDQSRPQTRYRVVALQDGIESARVTAHLGQGLMDTRRRFSAVVAILHLHGKTQVSAPLFGYRRP